MIRHSFLIYVLLLLSFLSAAPEKLTLHFFGSSTCGECNELKVEILTPLATKHSDSLEIIFYDTDNTDEMETLLAFEKKYGVIQSATQELFFPDTFLMGFNDIYSEANDMVSTYLSDRTKWKSVVIEDISEGEVKTALKTKVESYTFWGIVGLGIIDGINPCAIATMIFLISFLAAQKRSKRDILIIGFAYTITVFVTYTTIGIVAFESLNALKEIGFVSHIVKWSAVLLAGGVALFSFIDAYNFGVTKKTSSIKLQLPDSLKKQMHKVITGNMKNSNLIIGTVITGFLVTILETFCTGQTYLPAIQAMVKTAGMRFEGWLRLLFYNFLFVMPLLFVMIAAYFGLTWNKLAKETQKNMVLLKVILGTVMTILTVYLIIV